MDAYLPWLEARVRSRGGELHRRSLIGNIADIAGSLRNEFDAACVVQASGLGAESLGDRSMLPVRGALIQVVNNGKQFPKVSQAHCMSSGPLTGLGEFIFVVPKGDERLLLGGVAQPGERQLAIDVKDGVIAEMFERCSEFLPMLKDAEMVMAEPIRVGLRPFRRSGPRVELDPEAAICHCYGHGGAGVMLSWGCAEEVTRLVWKLLKR